MRTQSDYAGTLWCRCIFTSYCQLNYLIYIFDWRWDSGNENLLDAQSEQRTGQIGLSIIVHILPANAELKLYSSPLDVATSTFLSAAIWGRAKFIHNYNISFFLDDNTKEIWANWTYRQTDLSPVSFSIQFTELLLTVGVCTAKHRLTCTSTPCLPLSCLLLYEM